MNLMKVWHNLHETRALEERLRELLNGHYPETTNLVTDAGKEPLSPSEAIDALLPHTDPAKVMVYKSVFNTLQLLLGNRPQIHPLGDSPLDTASHYHRVAPHTSLVDYLFIVSHSIETFNSVPHSLGCMSLIYKSKFWEEFYKDSGTFGTPRKVDNTDFKYGNYLRELTPVFMELLKQSRQVPYSTLTYPEGGRSRTGGMRSFEECDFGSVNLLAMSGQSFLPMVFLPEVVPEDRTFASSNDVRAGSTRTGRLDFLRNYGRIIIAYGDMVEPPKNLTGKQRKLEFDHAVYDAMKGLKQKIPMAPVSFVSQAVQRVSDDGTYPMVHRGTILYVMQEARQRFPERLDHSLLDDESLESSLNTALRRIPYFLNRSGSHVEIRNPAGIRYYAALPDFSLFEHLRGSAV